MHVLGDGSTIYGNKSTNLCLMKSSWLRISFSLKRSVTSRALRYRATLWSSGGRPSPLESLVYALLLHLPDRNNHQEWQVRASAMLFRACSFLQPIAQQTGDSACLVFFTSREKDARGCSCAAALRIPKLTLQLQKEKIKYGFQRKIKYM